MMRAERSESIKELTEALAKAQAEMQAADKNAMNPHFGKKYADLAGIIDAMRGPFSKVGLCFTQTKIFEPESHLWFLMTTIHLGDQYISDPTPIIVRGQTSQDFGAALTYSRRQGLQTLVGVAADEDDDGNMASGRGDMDQRERKQDRQPRNEKPAQERKPDPTPPADPNALVTEFQAKEVNKAAKAKGWISSLSQYILKKYNAERLGVLNQTQLAELMVAIGTSTPEEALTAITPPVTLKPGDFGYVGPATATEGGAHAK